MQHFKFISRMRNVNEVASLQGERMACHLSVEESGQALISTDVLCKGNTPGSLLRQHFIVYFISAICLLNIHIQPSYAMSFKKIEHRLPKQIEPSVVTIPRSMVETRQALLGMFRNKHSAFHNQFDNFTISEAMESGIPIVGTFSFEAWADPPNMDVKRYMAIEEKLRHDDLFLRIPGNDKWWKSEEYFMNDRPVDYRCNFILHLQPQTSTSTRIEVFGFQSIAWVGEKLSGGHGVLPGKVHDLRSVPPALTDKAALAALIKHFLIRP